MKSARYPRVAVLLGVDQYYYIPLLVCRFFSVIFTLVWTFQAGSRVYHLLKENNGTASGTALQSDSVLIHRLQIAQVALSFLWAAEAAYLSHIFASSLMSRWLHEYSPPGVLIRLVVVSLFLAFVCGQTFNLFGASALDLGKMARCLPIWIFTCICLLVSYFTTQQDVSIEQDRDDRRRRLILRLKCLYTTAACSLISLLALILVIQLGPRSMQDVKHGVLLWIRAQLQQITQIIDTMVYKEEL